MKFYSVTQVLGKYVDFSRVPDQILYDATKRGRIVHRAAAAYVLKIFVAKMSWEYQGYLDSFKRWFDTYVVEVIFVEKIFIDHEFCFTGQPDFLFRLSSGALALVDLKTPATVGQTWPFQLGAYWYLVTQDGFKPDKCFALRPQRDGSEAKASVYQYIENDFFVFLSALNAHRNIIG